MDDLISRQDAIDALYNASEDLSDNMWSANFGITCEKMVEILNNLPSANPPQGEWVLCEEQKHVELMYYCSECGFIAWGEYEKTNYCPNCGSYNGGEKK